MTLREPLQLQKSALNELQISLFSRMLSSVSSARRPAQVVASNLPKLCRSLGQTWDRDTALAVLVRAIARSRPVDVSSGLKSDDILDAPRQSLLSYVVSNFHESIDLCVMWLNEEWYNESTLPLSSSESIYLIYLTKIMDAILPFLESKDRLLMRFLSDLPLLSASIIEKLKILCLDPDRSTLGYTTLQ